VYYIIEEIYALFRNGRNNALINEVAALGSTQISLL